MTLFREGWAGALLLAAAPAALAAADQRFEPVQAQAFAIAGSLAVAWADFDQDGLLDLVVSTKDDGIILYRQVDGAFVNVSAEAGLPSEIEEIRGLAWGDFTGNGYPDLIAGSSVFPNPTRSYLFVNEGGRFTEEAEARGLAIPGRFSRQASWIDFDNDGRLDLYAADRGGANRLYRNTGGDFEPLADEVGVNDPRRTVGACWYDVTGNGRLDLFLANQSGDTDALWRNDGNGQFTDIAPELGMDAAGRGQREGGVGCAVGDFTNNGHFDIYVATYGDNLLYRNNGDGSFSDVAGELGVDGPQFAVAAAWADFDNDGLLDLMVIGYVYGEDRIQIPANVLYRNTGDGFEDVTAQFPGINQGTHGIEWADYDSDGAVDLVITKGYTDVGGHFLFRNVMVEAGRARGLNVFVAEADGRSAVPGAEVRVYSPDGALLGSRLMNTGGGYNSQSAAPVHFGLPEPGEVVVEVTFMSDGGRITQRQEGVDPFRLAGRTLVVTRDP
jgi:hypothetical protein